MFDKVGKDIDAVTVSTPDHTHAVATAMALKMGKACYTQKPLTRTIWEARTIADREHPMIVERSHPGIHRDPAIGALTDALSVCAGSQPIGWMGTGRNQHQVSVQRKLDTWMSHQPKLISGNADIPG